MESMEKGYRILPAAEVPGAEAMVPRYLPWLVQAGNPYYTAVYGSSQRTLEIVADWPLRPSSELALARTDLAIDLDGRLLGANIDLSGEELRTCRAADAAALFKTLGRQEMEAVAGRLRAMQGMFMPLEKGDYYWSKMGVDPEFWGLKLGRRFAELTIARARSRGYRRMVIEVWEENVRAVTLYHHLGYRTLSRRVSKEFGFTYLIQTLEL